MRSNDWFKWGFWTALFVCGVVLAAEVWNGYNQKMWDGLSRFTVVEINKTLGEIRVKSIDPETKGAVMLILPGEMEIKTVGGKGIWKVSSIPELTVKYGYKWAGDSVGDFLGIPYTAVEEDLGFWDKLAWRGLSGGVQWQELNLLETSWIDESRDPDGAKVLGLSEAGRKKLGEMFYSTKLAKLELQVTVFNTTNVVGLGARFAWVLENAGFKVVMVGEKEGEVGECLVLSNSNYQENAGVKWIMKNFACGWRKDESLQDKEVNVLVGRDYDKWLSGD